MTSKAAAFAANFVALHVAHHVADHWIQRGHDALHKGDPGPAGAKACASHVASYTATTAVATLAVNKALGIRVHPAAWLAGQAVSAVTHYVMDRRPIGAAIAALAGKGELWKLGAPRAGRDDNPVLGTGAYALDQSWHTLWLGTAALLTAACAGRQR